MAQVTTESRGASGLHMGCLLHDPHRDRAEMHLA